MKRTGQAQVVVDVVGLQTPTSADRGIGRYTRDCFEALEKHYPELVTIYAYEPNLPIHRNLQYLQQTGKLRPNSHPEVISGGHDLYHVASFWDNQQVLGGLPAWVSRDRTATIATVFDVIPLMFPEDYHSQPRSAEAFRIDCESSLVFDRIVTISSTSASDIVRMLGVPGSRVVPIHGGASGDFRPRPSGSTEFADELAAFFPEIAGKKFLLAPVGLDSRKNLSRLIEAYLGLPVKSQLDHPLVLQGVVDSEVVRKYDRTTKTPGGKRIIFTGYVSDHELQLLYQSAHFVVFPSTYEGLGLAALEAQSCGTAVICGDNSALREVVADERARFDAQDVGAIRECIAKVLGDEDLRRELAAAPVHERYRWDVAAERLAEVYAELVDRPPRARRSQRRKRLAISSPAPPSHSGPAVYLSRLLDELVELCEVTLFTSDADELPEVHPRVSVEPLSDLELIEAIDGEFDELLYFLGNSELHIPQELAQRIRPGCVFLHDARLVGLYRSMASISPQSLPHSAGLAQSLRLMYPDRYDRSMESLEHVTNDEIDRLNILMSANVSLSAKRLFVHSAAAAEMVELDCGRRPEILFPHPLPVLPRSRNTWPDLVVSFGVLSPVKGTGQLLEAWQHVDVGTRLALVGPVDEGYRDELQSRIVHLGLQDRVFMTGDVSPSEYLSWLDRASIAIQLRMSSNGESSGTVSETIAAGLPTIVSDLGAFASLPDDLVVKIPAGSPALAIAASVRALMLDPLQREERSSRGLLFAELYNFRTAAEKLVKAILEPT
jgi:glycosyltransferase involved in cell wall biosynthesis